MTVAITPVFLMANLGTEFSRIFTYRNNKNSTSFKVAISQIKNIISQLKSFPVGKNNSEIDILLDIAEDVKNETNKYEVSGKDMDEYFYPFAIRCLEDNRVLEK
jgi:hypothetical protein